MTCLSRSPFISTVKYASARDSSLFTGQSALEHRSLLLAHDRQDLDLQRFEKVGLATTGSKFGGVNQKRTLSSRAMGSALPDASPVLTMQGSKKRPSF